MNLLTSLRLVIPLIFLAALGCAPAEPPSPNAEQRLKAIEEKLDRLTKSVEADTARRIETAVRDRAIELLKAEVQRLDEKLEIAEQEHQVCRQRYAPVFGFGPERAEVYFDRGISFEKSRTQLECQRSNSVSEATFIGEILAMKDGDERERAARVVIQILRSQGLDISAILSGMEKKTLNSSTEVAKACLALVNSKLKTTETKLNDVKVQIDETTKLYRESVKWEAECDVLRTRILYARELRDAAQKRLQEAQAARGGEAPKKN